MVKSLLLLFASAVSQDVFLAWPSVRAPPNYHGCLDEKAKRLPYCDTSLDIEARLDDLMSRLSLAERIAAISPQPRLGSDTCGDHTAGKPEIGLPDYYWLVETNTAVTSACLAAEKCATTFVGPLGLGASFNRSSWRLNGEVLGTEMRAFSNAGWHRRNAENRIALTGFGPNINLVRDPRFGRASELPGEDPYLNGHYAKETVLGMQAKDAKGHPKMLAYLKHFTAYSRETNRGHDSYDVSMHDLHESYLAAYKIAFTEGQATGAMCSYNAINGVPSCANSYVLNEVVRTAWGREDAHITTDCGAVSNLRGAPANAPSDEAACAWTINNGTDLEMGSTTWTNSMQSAVEKGMVDEATIEASARRAFRILFRAGRFDPLEDVEWTKITTDAINSTRHQQIAREAALQSFVLLKNEDSLLPLSKGSRIAVVGPMGVNRNLFSDYAGDEECFGGGFDCVPTIAEAIAAANVGGETPAARGVDVNSDDTSGIDAAMDIVRAADAVVLVLGNDRSQEHEGIDRSDTPLPGQQEAFAAQVLAAGKPTVLVLSNGGALAIDHILAGERPVYECSVSEQLGCYVDGGNEGQQSVNLRLLPAAAPGQKSQEDCAAACRGLGLPQGGLCGMENGGECWCGSSKFTGEVVAKPASECNLPCGDSSESCGGFWRLRIFRGDCATATQGEKFPSPGAIVEAFNPSFEAGALASALFGNENRWGKLPVTMYPHSFTAENPMTNYDMSKAPGRTYKYYTGEPLFSFGHGLSYTEFDLKCASSGSTMLPMNVTCKVTNKGPREGDEVVMMYHSAGDDVRSQAKHPVPQRALVNFDRASLGAGEAVEMTFTIDKETITLIDENGAMRTYSGSHRLIFSRGHGKEQLVDILVQ